MMDKRRVLLANPSKGAIGDGPGRLLGALLVTALAQAALSRRDTPEASRVPFHLYIDEFQNFASTGFDLILSEARKYGLTLTLAHQYIDQLPEQLRQSVFGNAGSILSFRVGASDAPILSRQLDIANEAAIKELPNYTARASILSDGQPTQAFQLSCAAPPKPLHHRAHRHKRHSHLRFGRHRDALERRIAALYEVQGSHSDKL
jgi:TraM recognition site of TraD and TraG